MKIRLLFFSLLQDFTSREEIDYPLPSASITVGELLKKLYGDYKELADWDEKLLIAVNCEYASRSDLVKSGDEVAIMPPVQGG
ncbi:MAG: MoaD/ThiS family protein [Verrucomicrobiales bacterium]|nr:MoaD/ThiS family protein [Verrucomicrobiales bacterium]